MIGLTQGGNRLRTRSVVFTACVAASAVALFWWLVSTRGVSVQQVASTVSGDGREHRIAILRRRWPLQISAEDVLLTGSMSRLRLEQTDRRHLSIYLRSPVMPGHLQSSALAFARTIYLTTSVTPSLTDSAGDGTPDFLRLHSAEDRLAFREWFVHLALQAADEPREELPGEITDCASLLRWAYRASLLQHDDRWYKQFAPGEVPVLPSVSQWTYPNTPLGANLFRITPGPFQALDFRSGAFAQFADARTLFSRNAFLLGRDVRTARPGDLLFFHQLEEDSTYHSMIVTDKRGEWVVYHTGPIEGKRGEMRRVLVADLLHHPDPRWHPSPSNPNFLGVYRWNILRED